MIAEQVFHQLLNFGACWEVRGVDYECASNRFVIIIGEAESLWPAQICPQPRCRQRTVTCYGHADTRSWRHLDVIGKRSEILCAVPRGRCAPCAHVYRVPVPWEGEGKHFTKEFEAFALTLMREMPVSKAGELVGETDPRLWQMLLAHVAKTYAALELSAVCWIGADGMNCRKGHDYLTVFADLVKRLVVFATEGRDAATSRAFVQAWASIPAIPRLSPRRPST